MVAARLVYHCGWCASGVGLLGAQRLTPQLSLLWTVVCAWHSHLSLSLSQQFGSFRHIAVLCTHLHSACRLLVFAVDRHCGPERSQSLLVPIQICCRCCAKGHGGRGAASGVPAVAAVSVLGEYCFYFQGEPGVCAVEPPSYSGCCPACVPLRVVRFWCWSTGSSEANATAVFTVDSGLRLALTSFSFSLLAILICSPHCGFVHTSTLSLQIVGICSGSSLWPGKIAILAGANSAMLRMLCKGTWRPWSSFWRSCSCCGICAWQLLLLFPRCA